MCYCATTAGWLNYTVIVRAYFPRVWFFFSVPIGFSAVPAVPPGLFGGTTSTSRAAARAPPALVPPRAPPQHTGRGEEGVFALAL